MNMQCWPQSQDPFESAFGDSKVDQPLDFSVKSPGSFGGSERDFCSPSHHIDQRSTSRSSKSRGSNGSLVKDDQYWQRREKNNAAAKRSRDARRQKEEETKRKCRELVEENARLKNDLRFFQDHVHKCPIKGSLLQALGNMTENT